MTTDFRALCAELADELDAETGYTKNDGERITHDAVARARIALATPPPEPPTAGEVVELVRWMRTISKHYRIDRAATLLEQLSAPAPVGVPMVLTKPQLEKLNEVLHSHQDEGPPYPEGWASPELEDLRQIIDRWSTAPAPAVVPVGDATTLPKPQPTGGRQIGPSF